MCVLFIFTKSSIRGLCYLLSLIYYIGCRVLICDFHREQAWERWLSKISNMCSKRKGDILPILRRIARSRTEQEMTEAITSIENSEFWTDNTYSKLKIYLQKYWFPIKEVAVLT